MIVPRYPTEPIGIYMIVQLPTMGGAGMLPNGLSLNGIKIKVKIKFQKE